jgi:hypothetical protein
MANHIRPDVPLVPNPVNPAEDFADKWYAPKHAHLGLARHFRAWLEAAQRDFALIQSARNPDVLIEHVEMKLGARIQKEGLEDRVGFGAASAPQSSKVYVIKDTPAKPWCSR